MKRKNKNDEKLNEFFDDDVVEFLKSFKDFSKAYNEIKAKIQETNSFVDGLEIRKKVFDQIESTADELEIALYVRINERYVLVYEEKNIVFIQYFFKN